MSKLPRLAQEVWIKSRERYNKSSSFSKDLMKRKSFRASRARIGGGEN